ncbi:MAG TPA: hypothetical protein VI757_00085, partial [Bacteroidia bacterium]|nr:hypothetical protein [Bacteroidia bacterium]
AATGAGAQDTAKAEFKPSGKVWGYVFGDYYFKVKADSALRGSMEYSGLKTNNNAFAIRRAYLGYDYNISEKLSTEFLLSHEANLDASGNRTVFIKSANLRIKKIYKRADLVIGHMATPTFSLLEEKVWNFRAVEKTILDQRKIASSSDIGVGLQGKFDEKGNYGYNLMVGNGTGTKLESDQFKRFYGDLFAKFLDQKLIINVYADMERSQLQPYHKSKTTFKAFAAYQTTPFTIGVTWFMQTQENYAIYTPDATSPADTNDLAATGISAFVRGTVVKDKLNFFARYDMYNPDDNYSADYLYTSGSNPVTETFITAGLDWLCHKNVHIMPNIWYNAYNSRAKNVTGKIESDNDMVARVTAYFIFR